MAFDSPKLITLTLKGGISDLAACLDKLQSSMKRLRATDLWTSNVRGGVWSVEVTRGRTGRHWHAHAHVLVDAEYMPQKLLSEAWLRITEDSYIVDIRACYGREQAASYVAKYATKPTSVATWSADLICEYARAMKGRRLIQTFGSAHGANVDPADPNETECVEVASAPLDFISIAAHAGDIHALAIIRCLLVLNHEAGRLLVEDGPPPMLHLTEIRGDPIEVLHLAMLSFRMHTHRVYGTPAKPPPPTPPYTGSQGYFLAADGNGSW